MKSHGKMQSQRPVCRVKRLPRFLARSSQEQEAGRKLPHVRMS